MEEFQEVVERLKALLDDLEWRKPDVEHEEAKLRDLEKQAKTDPMVDVASQAIVVRVLRSVLEDKIQEAEGLEKRMLELKAQLEAPEKPAPKVPRRGKRGKALR